MPDVEEMRCAVCALPTTTTCATCDRPLCHDKSGCLRYHAVQRAATHPQFEPIRRAAPLTLTSLTRGRPVQR